MSERRRYEISPAFADLFTTQEDRDDAKLEKVRILPLEDLQPFPNHPFAVRDDEEMEKLVDSILRITLPCMIFNSFNNPLTPEVMKQTALILVVAVSISILSFLLGKVIYNKYPQKKKSILQYCTLATIPVLMLFL